MELRKLCKHTGQWFSGQGPMSDIVISSRVRLARNLAGYEFVSCCNENRLEEILIKVKDVVLSLGIEDELCYIDVDKAARIDKDFLVERHIISRNHANAKGCRGVVLSKNEMIAAMINEEDHLRIQVLKPGLQLKQCWEQINKIDDMIEDKISYAFNPNYGYLTACPTNVGTGIRVSVMLHLPALKITGHLDKFFNAAKAMNLAVRGLFGEGTEAVGDFFQLSNQTTLGINEQEIVDEFNDVLVPEIVEYEHLARQELLDKKLSLVDDKIFRAMGILKHAQMISSQEALFLLSHLRMGLNMKRIDDISVGKINELFMLTQPAHLQMSQGGPLTADNRDELRARIIRQYLGQQN